MWRYNTVVRSLQSNRNNKKPVEEEDTIPQLQSGYFWSLEVIPLCNRSFSCAFMKQLSLCKNRSLRPMSNKGNSLSAENLVFHHVQWKTIFPCHKMKTDVEARLTYWSSRSRHKASAQSESRQVGQSHLSASLAHPSFKSSSAISDDMF